MQLQQSHLLLVISAAWAKNVRTDQAFEKTIDT